MQSLYQSFPTAEWLQPKVLSNYYELKSGDDLLAVLAFRSAFGTLATAQTVDGIWTYKRVGFLNTRVTVRAEGSDDDLAVYHPKFWGDGTLRFRDGLSFAWKPSNFWSTRFAFLDDAGSPVVSFEPGRERGGLGDLLKTQFTVRIPAPPDAPGILPILVTLGAYLMILHQQDAAAVSASAAAT